MKFENLDIDKHEDKVAHIEINYPRNSKIDTIDIGLCEVRAADGIRVFYDFHRDGWVVQQPRSYYEETGENSFEGKEEWIESGFFPAWKYELEEEEKFSYTPNSIKSNDYAPHCTTCGDNDNVEHAKDGRWVCHACKRTWEHY